MSKPLGLAILISGNGSNLQAVIDAIAAGRVNAEIKTVVSDNREAHGLVRAAKHGLNTRIFDRHDYDSRKQFDLALQQYLQSVNPDYIVLAGFMHILRSDFILEFKHKILNIHPSLLPAYKGLNTHQRVLENAETHHGVSIHLVTAELDAGPVILQASYPIEKGNRVEDLQTTGRQLEHKMYPQVLGWLGDAKLTIDGGRPFYEGALLEKPIIFNS